MASIAVTLAITAGSMALQALFAPKIKQSPVDKGKFDDIRITGFDYGAYIPRVWGSARLGGNVVVSTGIDHTIIEQPTQGGKGTPSAPATRTHVYKTDAAILFCRGEIEQFKKVWADADIIVNDGTLSTEDFIEAEAYDSVGGTNPPAKTTDADFAPPASDNGILYPSGAGGNAVYTITNTAPSAPIEPTTPRPRTRISLFYKSTASNTITVSTNGGLYSSTVNVPSSGGNVSVVSVVIEGIALTIQIDKDSSGATFALDEISTYQFFESVDYPDQFNNITMQVNPNIAYPTDLDDPLEYYNYKSEYDANGEKSFNLANDSTLRFYLGSETQTQDAAIMAWLDGRFGSGEGLLRASAMRGLAFIVVDDRVLRQGRLENFTAECVQSSSPVSFSTIIKDIGAEAGLADSDFEVDANPPRTVAGYVNKEVKSLSQIVEPILRWSQRRLADLDGKIKVLYDGPVGDVWDNINQSSYTHSVDYVLDLDLDVRGHTYGDDYPEYDIEIERKEPGLQPLQTKVSYLNQAIEYHNDSADSDVYPGSSALDISEYSFPVVSDSGTAKTIADELQRKATMGDMAFQWSGTPNMAEYTVGDVVEITQSNKTYYARIERCQRQLPHGAILYQALRTNKLTPGSDPAFAPETFKNEAQELDPPRLAFAKPRRNTILEPIISKAVRDEDKEKTGFYAAVSGRGRGHWENASLYVEKTTDNYEFLTIIDSPSPMGIAQETLSGTAGKNSVEVYFFDDVSLESASSAELLADPLLNLARIGDEWVQFATVAELTMPTGSPYRSGWELSDLANYRGKFDTSGETETHAADEVVSIFTRAMRFIELDADKIGTSLNFKAVTADQSITNAPVVNIASFNPPVNNVAKTLLSHYEDVATTGTTQEVIQTLSLAANQLGTDGDMIEFHYFGQFASNANTKSALISFDSNDIGSLSTSQNGGAWRIEGRMIREDSANVRVVVRSVTDTASEGWTDIGDLAIDLTSTFDLELKATTATASGDLTLTGGFVRFIPGIEAVAEDTVIDTAGDTVIVTSGDTVVV